MWILKSLESMALYENHSSILHPIFQCLKSSHHSFLLWEINELSWIVRLNESFFATIFPRPANKKNINP